MNNSDLQIKQLQFCKKKFKGCTIQLLKKRTLNLTHVIWPIVNILNQQNAKLG